jgi:hypothetical protein
LGFYKLLGISWPNEDLSAYQEGLCSVDWVRSSDLGHSSDFAQSGNISFQGFEIGDVSDRSLRGRWCRLLSCDIRNILYLCMCLWAYW